MAFSVIILIFLIGFIYRKQPAVDKNRSVFYQYRKLIALLALALLPIIAINIFVPSNPQPVTADDHLDVGIRDKNPAEIFRGYKMKKKQYPDSTEIQMLYMDAWTKARSRYTFNWMEEEYQKLDNPNSPICEAYGHFIKHESIDNISRLDSVDSKLKFSNLMKGLYYKSSMNPDSAEFFVKKEINVNPNFSDSYDVLVGIYRIYSSSKLDSIMHDWPSFTKIGVRNRIQYYYSHALPLRYMLTQYENTFLRVDLFSYIASFFVSGIWLIFIWYASKRNRMKWSSIAALFILAVFFADFCHFFYDYALYNLDFGMNGGAWNDLSYLWWINGGGEELVKLIPWVIFGLLFGKLKNPINYFVLASIAGLGFAFSENLYYMDYTGNIVVRTVLTAVVHMTFSTTIAYTIVLAKFKYSSLTWKIILPLAGFIVASLFHGLFNFFILSNAVSSFAFVHYILFIFYLWLWFYYRRKMNKMSNKVSIVGEDETIHQGNQIDLLNFGIIFILMLEYVLVSLEYGTMRGSYSLGSNARIIAVFLVFSSLLIEKTSLKPTAGRYRFNWTKLGGSLFSLPGRMGSGNTDAPSTKKSLEYDLTGLKLRLYAPKTNRFVGAQFPVQGVCIQKICVHNDPNWYVLELDRDVVVSNYLKRLVIIKTIGAKNSLENDKAPIYMMFVPEQSILSQDNIEIKQLRSAGRVFSRPIQ